jgi:3-oxoacyl-[acyl-carrier protein] reductase
MKCFDLNGKKALVTGATGAIGSSIAKYLKANGAELLLTGTRENVLKDLAEE